MRYTADKHHANDVISFNYGSARNGNKNGVCQTFTITATYIILILFALSPCVLLLTSVNITNIVIIYLHFTEPSKKITQISYLQASKVTQGLL